MSVSLESLDFSLNKAIRYFSKRRRYFDLLHRISKTLVLAGGSSSFTALVADFSEIAVYATLIIAIVGLVDYIFDFSGQSRLYDNLYRRTVNLTSRIYNLSKSDTESVCNLVAERYLIFADCPAINRVLDVICHNEEAIARGYDKDELYKISKFQYFLSPFFRFQVKILAVKINIFI